MSGNLFNILWSALAFLVALGVLISIHEFGHFWVARKMDVKVLKFSIGFGRSVWSRRGRVDGTEYAVAMVPLGGYVRMLDEREGPVKPQELHRAFNRKSVWARIAVVAAGPLANFLLAIVVYWLVFLMGISGIAPVVGEITPDTPAAEAGFQAEDLILSVDGKDVPSWSEARIALLKQAVGGSSPILIGVKDADGSELVRPLEIGSTQLLKSSKDPIGELGFGAWYPMIEPIIDGIKPGEAASAAGMLIGDRVLKVNEEPVETWLEWVRAVQAYPDTEISVDVERDGQPVRLLLVPAALERDGVTIGYVGAWEERSRAMFEQNRVTVKYPPGEALIKAAGKTWDFSLLTVRMLYKLVTGNASLQNISGPISIAQYAGQSASIGFDHFLDFLAIISISLAVLNLLPIPLLDGGHLLYYLVEIVIGKPVPERVQVIGQQFGLVLLGGLMMLAFYNDIWRLFG